MLQGAGHSWRIFVDYQPLNWPPSDFFELEAASEPRYIRTGGEVWLRALLVRGGALPEAAAVRWLLRPRVVP